jgi:hypothetical protein
MTASRRAVSVLALILVTIAGLGWLYLLVSLRILGFGPDVPAALQLQRLAGNAAQPVLRVVAAWLPTGVAAGTVLLALGWRSRAARAALGFGVTAVLLLALGAAADAVTASEPLGDHLRQQPQRLAPWLAAGLVGAGAAVLRARS